MKRIKSEYNKIRALVVQDFVTGDISTIYDKSKFEDILTNYTEWEVTKIYEVTKEQEDEWLQLMLNNTEEGIVNVDVQDLFVSILPIMTDIPFDTSIAEDKAELEEMIEFGGEYFNEVKKAVEKILVHILNNFKEKLDNFNSLSEEDKANILSQIKKETEEVK